MKKCICKIILIMLFIIIFTNYTYVFAASNNIIITTYSDDGYTLDITIRNFKYEQYDIAYVGQSLSNLYPICKVTNSNNEIISGYCEWENKNYILTDGIQNVVLIFYPYIGKEIRFLVTIKPMVQEVVPEVKHVYFVDYSDVVFERYEGSTLEEIVPVYKFWSVDEKNIEGTMEYFNYDDLSIGYHEIVWKFTPYNNSYETKEGVYKVQIIPRPEEKNDEELDEPTTPSLTATVITLNTSTTFDINLDNKVSGSTYEWTSSNPDIVEVNKKNGLIKALKEGKATITCKITFPDNTTQKLYSEVIVGYDENAPVLTETVLDLEVGDKFDINLENKIAKSKYRWASSDRSVVKVNSSNGVITAVGIGTAYVTCTITTPDKQVIVLRCDINVDAPSTISE